MRAIPGHVKDPRASVDHVSLATETIPLIYGLYIEVSIS